MIWGGACRSRGTLEGDAESRQPGLAGPDIDEDVRRLDVLVHDALLVQLAQRFGDAERDPQEDP